MFLLKISNSKINVNIVNELPQAGMPVNCPHITNTVESHVLHTRPLVQEIHLEKM